MSTPPSTPKKSAEKSILARPTKTPKTPGDAEDVDREEITPLAMVDDLVAPAAETAVLIVKGALSSTLGIPLGRTTVGVNFPSETRARLTVLVGPTAPTDEDLEQVLTVSNGLISENLPCYAIEIPRSDAGIYGDLIHDKHDVSKFKNFEKYGLVI